MSVRSNRSIAYSGNGWRADTGGPRKPYTIQFMNEATIQDNGPHPGFRHSSGDSGGACFISKIDWDISPGFWSNRNHTGPWVATTLRGSGQAPLPRKSESQLNAMGTTAIARCEPTNPAFNLANSLGELGSDGLPAVIGSSAFKSRVLSAKKAGDEFLNYEFGWLPLVSDVRRFAHAVKHRDKIMKSYMKGSDRKIRSRYQFPTTSTSASKGGTNTVSSFSSVYAYSYLTNVTSEDIHFSGAFRYHVPTPVDFHTKAAFYKAEADKLLGVRLTPELMWNLAPWSWAADWFSNTGDIMHNISALGHDGLAMQYGYIVHSSKSVMTLATNARWDYFGEVSYSSTRLTSSHYARYPATPYGFGTTFDKLSSTQQAVVVALGLSRSTGGITK